MMKDRCRNQKSKDFKYYGGRGIKVCDGLYSGYSLFKTIMGDKPGRQFSIDRIKNQDGYVCGRCDDCRDKGHKMNLRWATKKEQMCNTRRSRVVQYKGKPTPFMDLVEKSGLSWMVLYNRIFILKWPVEEAMNRPKKLRKLHSISC